MILFLKLIRQINDKLEDLEATLLRRILTRLKDAKRGNAS